MADVPEQYAEQLLDTANETARTVNGRLITFLSVGAYIAMTIAATTDEMLVRASVVTLPLLDVRIPISGFLGFYNLAPWLIVLLHWDVLLQLATLGRKLERLQKEVGSFPAERAAHLRERLASFYFVQHLTGEAPSPFVRMLSGFILWLTAVALPLVLLLCLQVRFLPYHSAGVTWLHRCAVIVDAALIHQLWPQLSRSRRLRGRTGAGWRGLLGRLGSTRGLVSGMCLASVIFCLFVATIPADQTSRGRWFKLRNLHLREQVLTDPLPPQVINALRDGSIEQREQELDRVSPLNFLQGRDLRYADLFNAVLPRLDLRSQQSDEHLTVTELRGADLRWAQMQRVLLDRADLEQADLAGAQVQGGSLWSARMRRANLSGTQLQGTKLGGADLGGVHAPGAALLGADLARAQLQSADLSGASLQGAILRDAQLQGANLSGSSLQGADLSGARLDGAKLQGAQLQGVALGGAVIAGADFSGAIFDLTDVVSAKPEGSAGTNQRDVLSGARFDRCRATAGGNLRQCRAVLPADEYAQALTTFLVELACAEPYAARGLALQALYSTDVDRKPLARALLDARAAEGCRGVGLLPRRLQESLEHFLRAATEGVSGGQAATSGSAN
jgi:uncharacterized protein YjbI with pentapeptide repeats